LAAAVFEMRFTHFLFAIFAGRFVRFLTLSVLVLYFGPGIIALFGGVFKRHWIWVLTLLLAGICGWSILRRRGRSAETTKDTK